MFLEYNRLPRGTKWRMDLDEPYTVSSKRVPNQLRACCSVTIAVTVPALQEFAINPSNSAITTLSF